MDLSYPPCMRPCALVHGYPAGTRHRLWRVRRACAGHSSCITFSIPPHTNTVAHPATTPSGAIYYTSIHCFPSRPQQQPAHTSSLGQEMGLAPHVGGGTISALSPFHNPSSAHRDSLSGRSHSHASTISGPGPPSPLSPRLSVTTPAPASASRSGLNQKRRG
jgi:hypothetical protein